MTTHDLTTANGMLAYLQQNHFPKCANIQQLAGGHGGFTYRVDTDEPDRPTVVAKHAEGYAALAPEWNLDVNRMDFEARAMRFLSQPAMQSDPAIRIPQILSYDRENHVLVLEDAGPLPSLKAWTTAGKHLATCRLIGEAVGGFLAHLHNATAEDEKLLAEFNGNETAKNLSGKLYFGGLAKVAKERFGFGDGFIKEAASVGEQEVMERSDVLTIGDFWTGNVLVSAASSSEGEGQGGRGEMQLFVLDLELSKPGTAEFDIGQMAAEMYSLARFRKGAEEQGLVLLEAFLRSYRRERTVQVDAAKVAIRIGAHLIVITPMGWSSEATEEEMAKVAAEGRDFVRMGWEEDEEALGRSVLKPLM